MNLIWLEYTATEAAQSIFSLSSFFAVEEILLGLVSISGTHTRSPHSLLGLDNDIKTTWLEAFGAWRARPFVYCFFSGTAFRLIRRPRKENKENLSVTETLRPPEGLFVFQEHNWRVPMVSPLPELSLLHGGVECALSLSLLAVSKSDKNTQPIGRRKEERRMIFLVLLARRRYVYSPTSTDTKNEPFSSFVTISSIYLSLIPFLPTSLLLYSFLHFSFLPFRSFFVCAKLNCELFPPPFTSICHTVWGL